MEKVIKLLQQKEAIDKKINHLQDKLYKESGRITLEINKITVGQFHCINEAGYGNHDDNYGYECKYFSHDWKTHKRSCKLGLYKQRVEHPQNNRRLCDKFEKGRYVGVDTSGY